MNKDIEHGDILKLALVDFKTLSGESLLYWKAKGEELLTKMKSIDPVIVNILDRIDIELQTRG